MKFPHRISQQKKFTIRLLHISCSSSRSFSAHRSITVGYFTVVAANVENETRLSSTVEASFYTKN